MAFLALFRGSECSLLSSIKIEILVHVRGLVRVMSENAGSSDLVLSPSQAPGPTERREELSASLSPDRSHTTPVKL